MFALLEYVPLLRKYLDKNQMLNNVCYSDNIQLSHVYAYNYYIILFLKCQRFSPRFVKIFVINRQLRKMKKSCATAINLSNLPKLG